MSAISAVLPLKAYGRRYIEDPGRCHILLTSLATFAPDDMFEDIFVVVPARERAHAEALRRDWQSLPLPVDLRAAVHDASLSDSRVLVIRSDGPNFCMGGNVPDLRKPY
jgi:hypothetical protein